VKEVAPKQFPQDADAVLATLLELFKNQKQHKVCEILENSRATIEETGYDDWDGGRCLFTLYLDLPIKLFARVESDVPKMEKLIAAKFEKVVPGTGGLWLRFVNIKPAMVHQTNTLLSKIAPAEIEHLWKPGLLRLFLSHIAADKVAVSKLKVALILLGVDCFVAHEDIEPNQIWLTEIELALKSMHALAALITKGFHESKWTDQEVGFALGRGVLVIPVRVSLDPYGFIGKQQGLPGKLENPHKLASDITDVLLKYKTTGDKMREALILGFENAKSYDAAIAISKKLDSLEYISPDQLRRIEIASKENAIVKKSFYVPERIQGIVNRFKPPEVEEPIF
jgi:hypothetical protein